jgi:hypothetical protein
MKNVLLLCVAVGIAAVVGVTAQNESSSAPAPPPFAKASAAPLAPLSAPTAGATLAGEVREAIDVAQYTYLRLATPDGREVWAAVSKATVRVGAQVSIIDAARMTSFESATLKRKFDVIYFGNLAQPAAPSAGAALPPGHPALDGHGATTSPHGAIAAPLPSTTLKVAPAVGENATVIASLVARREALAGKPARVRGQVVKATPVQGVTYYRLRDGSSEQPGNAELVISSTAKAKLGDVVTFEGQVRTDVDVGIGFKYPVMLEAARVVD